MRLDALLFVVAVLWLLTSLLLLVQYRPGAAHAQHPGHPPAEYTATYIDFSA